MKHCCTVTILLHKFNIVAKQPCMIRQLRNEQVYLIKEKQVFFPKIIYGKN